ncbi:Os03g0362801 [Oryza sativa Japonica Group]|uniref:Uncharacterized protein n=2 Tax=Oryza sativa subsp. japonica TaxID=39947 RepID=A0A8J8YJ92_ORYSJ|nr:hypothetical protein OsJ_10939 [Oryza sativa Japonica Group]BAS84295.1 Os03g0362801 [Oryza sativa Japonica Group]
MAESEKAMGSPAATEPVKTPAPPATDGPSGDLMQRQYKEDADATHGTLVGDDTDESRRLFLADVVERLDAVCAEELEHADPSEQRLGRLDSARGCQWRHRLPTSPPQR